MPGSISLLRGPAVILRGAAVIAACALPVSAQIGLDTLRAADGATLDLAGAAVAASGDVVVVGAPQDDEGGSPVGAAFVYRRVGTTLVLEQKLVGSTSAPDDGFGGAVAASGAWIAVGAQDDDDTGPQSGSVFMFRFDGATWIEEQIVTPSDGVARAGFGASLDLDDDLLIVGAPGDPEPALARGSATVFRRIAGAWVEEDELLAPDGVGQDNLGASVAISGDVAVVGAPGDQDQSVYSGSAYVFRFDGAAWDVEAKLRSPDRMTGDTSGIAVDVQGDTAVLGTSQDDFVAHDAGSASVFRFDGSVWVFQQELFPSLADVNGQFGRSLALAGEDRLFVGAPYAGTTGTVSTFAFDGATWNELSTAGPDDGAGSRDHHGWAVAHADGSLVVGAPGDSVQAPMAGAARVVATDWTELGDALAGTTGEPRLIGAGGLVAGGQVALGLSDALGGSTAALVVGLSELGAPLKGGILVPDPFLVVSGLPVALDGTLTLAAGWPQGVPAGTSLWFQAWIVDGAGPNGFAASNGLRGTAP